MNNKFFAVCIILLVCLTGCKEINNDKNSDDSNIDVPETSQEIMVDYHEPPEDADLNFNNTFEVYENVRLSDLISDKNIKLDNSDEQINTSEIGNFSQTISYTYNNKTYEHSISYTVKDTTPPLLLNSGSGSVILVNEEFDLNDYVGYADNYDKSPELTYSGTVDTSVCGTYPLTATVTDSSNNETSWDMEIQVVDELPDNSSDSETDYLYFEDFKNQYLNENTRLGIDVSRWQGDIDFEAVKNAGCEFVIMRLGLYYDVNEMDINYLQYMNDAQAAGLEVGVYFYSTANTKEKAEENAVWIAQQLDGMKLDFPVVFDWEEFSNFQEYKMSIHDLNEYYDAFSNKMQEYGYSAMLYSSKNFLNNFWYEHSESPIWLAHYTDQTDYAGEYVMWQMSSCGKIDGIEGAVDLNILFNDRFNKYK